MNRKYARLVRVGVSLVVAMMLCTFVVSAHTFEDIKSDTAHVNAIESLTSLGIIHGYEDNTFRPDLPVRRDEMAKLVYTTLTTSTAVSEGVIIFPDVSLNSWAKDYISWCFTKNIVNGYEDGTFKPEGNVTYDEALKMVCAMLGYTEFKSDLWPFDVRTKALNDLNLGKGLEDVAGDAALTRAQVACLFYNSLAAPMYVSPADPKVSTLATDVWGYKENFSADTKNNLSSTDIIHNGIIPEGGTYYVGDVKSVVGDYSRASAIYTSGDPFPETVNYGDVYVYGDYEYRYNKFSIPFTYDVSWFPTLAKDPNKVWYSSSGWGVRVLDNSKTEYGDILTTINGVDVTYMSRTYAGCTAMTSAPAIPSTVTDMIGAYSRCSALSDISRLVLPEVVKDLSAAFSECISLTDVSNLVIPEGAVEVNFMFGMCSSLTGTVNIHANPTNWEACFEGTKQPITITGSCSAKTKANLAGTANNGNVTY